MQNNFQKRINYQGDLKPLLQQVCQDFNIGKLHSYEIVPIGYEDFNLTVNTNKGKFFIKIFGSFRNLKECKRYVEIIEHVLHAGVSHPALYQSSHGSLYRSSFSNADDKLCVMQYINGKIFYDLQITPSNKEMQFIIRQITLINKIDLKPSYIYDHWAITNFLKEYAEKKQYLGEKDSKLLEPLTKVFNSLSIEQLPHCFVHGDITKTNTMKSVNGDIYILDFAVANYYPRMQELAVLLCDLFFDPENLDDFTKNYNFALTEYQKRIFLTAEEVYKLPSYIKLAHAMHILLANYEKVANKNVSAENDYFLRMGRLGLQYTNKIWHDI